MDLPAEEMRSKGSELELNNYKARCVELARPMAGVLTLAIYSVLEDRVDEPNSTTALSNNIAIFLSWVLGEQIIHRICVRFNLYDRAHAKNPLYRNLKTLSSLGAALGALLALCTKNLSFSLCSMIMGSFIATAAFIIRGLGGEEVDSHAQLGTEGWSKYGKTALVFGSLIGQGLGGVLSYIQKSDTATSLSNISFYSALASVLSFVLVMALVPFINYLTGRKLTTKDKEVFNNNYLRSGATLGGAIGTLLGSLLVAFIFPGLSVSLAIAIGASTFALVGGIGFGVYGQKLSDYFRRAWGVLADSENTWSYATRSTTYLFTCTATILTYALCPVAALAPTLIISTAVATIIGWFAGLLVLCLARKIEPDEKKAETLPWTQRLSTGISRGMIIGSIIGLGLGCCAIGPFGLLGWSALIGAAGGLIGGVLDIIAEPSFHQTINKIVAPKTKETPISSNPYSMFSCEKIRAKAYDELELVAAERRLGP